MKIYLIILAPVFVALALRIQWKDCIRNYGNTMGVYGLINGLWLIAGGLLGIGISLFVKWYWALAVGGCLYSLYYPITAQVEKLGVKYGPRQNNQRPNKRFQAIDAKASQPDP